MMSSSNRVDCRLVVVHMDGQEYNIRNKKVPKSDSP